MKTIRIIILTLVFSLISCFIGSAQGVISKPTKSTTHKIQTQRPAVKKTSGTISGHDWVDLGLPSGLKWATYNIGAYSPEDYGEYFAWGETNSKEVYDSNNCRTNMSEYYLNSTGIINNRGVLKSSYDVAHERWGGSWRIPTKSEFQELIDKCNWIWSSNNGKMGYLIVGPNNNSIFLPLAGQRYCSSLIKIEEDGYYWSSTVYSTEKEAGAWNLRFSNNIHCLQWSNRLFGYSIRPVSK